MKKLLSSIILATILITPFVAFAEVDTSDQDLDRIFDSEDNCISVANADQADVDDNGIGDACDISTQDEDEDGFPDETDNCPDISNQQYDGNTNGSGIACDTSEQETFLETLSNDSDNALEDPNHTILYNQTIEEFGDCMHTTRGELCSFSQNGRRTYTPEPNSNSKMDLLYEELLNNKITTILEEPIGNENIYQRARICETQFLRDKNGLIQFRNNNTTSQFGIDFGVIASIEDLDNLRNEYVAQLDSGTEAIITLGKCEEFFVEKCTPAETETNNRFVKIGEPLPVKVFCDRVQILFSNSGSDLIKTYVGLIYRWAAGLIGIVAVLVIIINGIRISAAGGDQSAVEGARDSIVKSLTSIAILFLAGIILYSINPNFFTDSELQNAPPASTTTVNPTPPTNSTPSNTTGVGDFTIPNSTDSSA